MSHMPMVSFLFKVECLRVVLDKTFVILVLLDVFQIFFYILKLLLCAVKLTEF